MPRAVDHSRAAAGHDGGAYRSWLVGFVEDFQALLGRRSPTRSEAARVLGRAAAEKRARDNRTIRERYDDLHTKLRAERDAGWPGAKA